MPEDVWATLGTEEFPGTALHFLLRAGLRSPTEGTFKVMSTGFLLGGQDKEHAMTLDATSRQSTVKMTNLWFRGEAKQLTDVKQLILTDFPKEAQHLHHSYAEELTATEVDQAETVSLNGISSSFYPAPGAEAPKRYKVGRR